MTTVFVATSETAVLKRKYDISTYPLPNIGFLNIYKAQKLNIIMMQLKYGVECIGYNILYFFIYPILIYSIIVMNKMIHAKLPIVTVLTQY